MKKRVIGITIILVVVFLFGVTRCHSLWIVKYQRKLIVYNIPLHQSIDFVEGNRYFFKGDSTLNEEALCKTSISSLPVPRIDYYTTILCKFNP